MGPMAQSNHRSIGSPLPLGLAAALDGWRQRPGPLYLRLSDALAAAIEAEEILPGTKLPPERLLAEQLGVARTTVATALDALEGRGLLERRQGRGTHVAGVHGGQVEPRAADLTTTLQRNIIFRRLGDRGADAVDLLGNPAPGAAARAAVVAAAREVDFAGLMADSGYFPLGYPPLRRALAEHLTAGGLPSTEEEILVTAGAQQAISLLAAYYTKPGSAVMLEDPTFPGAIDAFRAAGAHVLSVAIQETGGAPGPIAAAMADGSVRAVYLMPTHHNPTGTVMPDPVRRELVRTSARTGVPIIEDGSLADLTLAGQVPPPLAAHGQDAPIVSIGSLSKLFWPGLRVGWIRAGRSMIAQLGQVKAVADLGTSVVSQAIACLLLGDAQRLREQRRQELGERLAILQDLLPRLLPDWTWRRPRGGMYVWCKLPDGSATELAQVASRHGVLIAPGAIMSPTGRFDDFVRLSFDAEPDPLRAGLHRLAAAWDAYATAVRDRGARRIDVIV